jgi:hypothetical protein
MSQVTHDPSDSEFSAALRGTEHRDQFAIGKAFETILGRDMA